MSRLISISKLAFFVAIFAFTQIVALGAENADACSVAVYRGAGASDTCALASLEILNNADDCKASFISAKEIQEGLLKDYDVVIFPGGTASGERKALGPDGWRELVKFLENGGGYYGTCAGAYLALVNLEREEGRLIDAELQEGEWERGEAILEIELTEKGREVIGDFPGRLNIAYQNGPIFHPANYDKLQPYEVLAYFRTETAENGAVKGAQIDSPALAFGAFGKGRVVICSPHPELTPNLNGFLPKLVRFAAQK